MALRLNDKKEIVTRLKGIVDKSVLAIAAEYRGLTVSEMTDLRASARKIGISAGVYRNTLARKAVQETDFACLQDSLVGPIMLFFSKDEPSASARLLRDYMKDHANFQVRALVLEGKFFAADQLKAIANLPSKEEALGQLLSVMQAPIVKLVRTLAEPYAQAVRVIAAIGDKKKAA